PDLEPDDLFRPCRVGRSPLASRRVQQITPAAYSRRTEPVNRAGRSAPRLAQRRCAVHLARGWPSDSREPADSGAAHFTVGTPASTGLHRAANAECSVCSTGNIAGPARSRTSADAPSWRADWAAVGTLTGTGRAALFQPARAVVDVKANSPRRPSR